jgi:hypothetical protein
MLTYASELAHRLESLRCGTEQEVAAAQEAAAAARTSLAAKVAYVSIRQVHVSIRQHTSAYVSIRQHMSAYVSLATKVAKGQVAKGLQAAYTSSSYCCSSRPHTLVA